MLGLSIAPGSAWVAWNANPVFSSALDQAESLFEEVGLKLEERGHVWQDVVLVYLYLADMTSYKVVNAVYAKYFPVNPPARYNEQSIRLA